MNGGTSSINVAAQGWTEFGGTALCERPPGSASLPGRLDGGVERAESEAQFAAVVLDLINKLAPAEDLPEAARSLVGELQEYFACQRVAFGLCRKPGQSCRVIALSGLAQFDPRSEFVR